MLLIGSHTNTVCGALALIQAQLIARKEKRERNEVEKLKVGAQAQASNALYKTAMAQGVKRFLLTKGLWVLVTPGVQH